VRGVPERGRGDAEDLLKREQGRAVGIEIRRGCRRIGEADLCERRDHDEPDGAISGFALVPSDDERRLRVDARVVVRARRIEDWIDVVLEPGVALRGRAVVYVVL